MKRLSKLASLLLALVMVFSLTATGLAAMEGDLTGGSITIKNPAAGETYSAYQILYLESYNAEAGHYAYKANSAWTEWLATQTDYVTIDAHQGYVTWVEGANAADFAKAAAAQLSGKTADGTAIAPAQITNSTEVEIENLKLGYYIVDTTLGSLCSLNTTSPNAVIEEKNEQPSNKKEVEEDSTGQYGAKNDADVGQGVNFTSTITVKKGTENIVLHDTMSNGLTFKADSVKVTVNSVEVPATAADGTTNWMLEDKPTDGHTFDVKFENAYIASLPENTQIVVSYTATVNSDAVVAGEGNPNSSKITFGDAGYTEESITTTYTWEFKVFKYTPGEDEGEKTPLAGAEFVLYKVENTVKYYAVVDANNKLTGWTTEAENASVLVSGTGGYIHITGLDADTYYLEETKAPAGYNKLATPVTVIIDNEGNVKDSAEGEALADKTINVENKAGSELPSTGGIGTTIFYILGTVLALGAAVLLVTKRRMSAN